MTVTSPYCCSHCKKPMPFGVSYCPHCGSQQTTNTGQLWMGDRRLITIVFADLSSFTSTSEKADPEDVIDMLNQVFTRLAVEYDKEGGYLDKTVGDQLMVLFGAPRAHEDDPVRAVRAALGMQAAMEELAPLMREKVGHAFKLNIGINTGIVVWGRMGPAGRTAATVIGDDVNLASRLEHYATNGQIIVSDPVYSLTRRYFEYEVLEPIKVKGKSKPIPIYRPLGPKRKPRSHKQISTWNTPLIERERELQLLHAHWSQAVAGQAQLVFLSSEAGLGKSRLIAEFAGDLGNYDFRKAPLVLHAFGNLGSSSVYSPLSEILFQLFDLKVGEPGLAARRKVEDRGRIAGMTVSNFVPLMGYLLGWYQDDDRLAAGEENVEKLRLSAIQVAVSLILKQAARRPLLITIDNLHQADETSLAWLKLLARRKAQEKTVAHELLVIAATRPRLEVPLEAFQADKIIALNPLSQPARLDLIASLLPGRGLPMSLVNRLSSESGGNPFYLEEAARGLVQSEQLVRRDGKWELTRPSDQIYIPHSIEGQVMAHLDILDEKSRLVLQHASVIGTNFDYGMLAAITPIENIEQSLEILEQRALIQETTAPEDEIRKFTFAQMMVREVAYRSMLRKARREIHEQIAALTEAETSSKTEDTDVASLARHYAAGGHEEKMVIYNWLAGQRAYEAANFEEAHQHLEIAFNTLKEMPDPGEDLIFKITNALGDASTFAGKFTQAAACYQQVWENVKNDPEKLVTLYYRIGRLNFFQDNIEAASTSYDYSRRLVQHYPELLPQIEAEIRLMYDLE